MHNRRDVIASLTLGLALLSLPTCALAQTAAPAKIPVVASFSILADLVKQVGGERVSVTAMVGPDGDAHAYTPTPADAKAIGAARLFVINGLSLEGWRMRMVKSSGTQAMIVEASDGITPLSRKADQHGHASGTDPHAWQNVANVKRYVANIRDALAAADPAGKPIYETNTVAYLGRLDALDAEIRAAVARIPAERRKAITAHDALGYFAEGYGIEFIAPQGVSTEAEASAKDVARIIRQVKAQKIPAIFMENITNPRLLEQIARESGAKIGGRLYVDALSAPSGPAGTYIEMMRHNIRQIEQGLGAE